MEEKQKTLGEIARDKWRDELALSEHTPTESWQAVADAVIAAHDARRWKPIKSAPKDGTPIILRRGERVTPGQWVPEAEENEQHFWDLEGRYQGSAIVGKTHPAYWMSDDGGFTAEEPPTNWTPIPAPPKEAHHGE